MSLISIAAEQPARLSASPNGPEPLRVAAASLRVHPVGDVTPASVVADPPRQTLRTDMLTSGYVPGSQSDKLFAALHAVNVHDDPNQSHEENERIFRGIGIKRQRLPASTRETYDRNLRETDEELARDVVELAAIADTTVNETMRALECVMDDHDISLREALDALLDEEPAQSADEFLRDHNARLATHVREQLHGEFASKRTRTKEGGGTASKPASSKAPEGSVGATKPASSVPKEGGLSAGASTSRDNVRKALKSIVARRAGKTNGSTDHIDTRPETKRTSIGEATLESFAAAYRKVGAR